MLAGEPQPEIVLGQEHHRDLGKDVGLVPGHPGELRCGEAGEDDVAGGRPEARVAVYKVGPTEQAQQVSTAARASEAITLAAAVAGKLPAQGIGLDGNAAFARSAMGRADARERVPLVVSFAEPGSSSVTDRCAAPLDDRRKGREALVPASVVCREEVRAMPAFGWLLGPRMTVDPVKKRMLLEQQIKPWKLEGAFVPANRSFRYPFIHQALGQPGKGLDGLGEACAIIDRTLARASSR